MSKTPENVQVGDGATYYSGSDRHPYTVVSVNKSGKTICVQRDKSVPTDKNEGIYGNQDYTFERNTDATIEVFTWRSNGRYHLKGTGSRGFSLHVGKRDKYYDPHF